MNGSRVGRRRVSGSASERSGNIFKGFTDVFPQVACLIVQVVSPISLPKTVLFDAFVASNCFFGMSFFLRQRKHFLRGKCAIKD
jgi:hypothetical protein